MIVTVSGSRCFARDGFFALVYLHHGVSVFYYRRCRVGAGVRAQPLYRERKTGSGLMFCRHRLKLLPSAGAQLCVAAAAAPEVSPLSGPGNVIGGRRLCYLASVYFPVCLISPLSDCNFALWQTPEK